MQFESSHIYHIFNQGNNRQQIFFNRENYLFFLKKIKEHILPHADILAWCLMPNHFHLMVHVKEVEVPDIGSENATATGGAIGSATQSRAPSNFPSNSPNNFNKSIGIMLASYTRAIHKQENMSGSLFRSKTKAECITKPTGITPAYYNTTFGTLLNIPDPERDYPQVCFDYIHNNPVNAGIVKTPAEWEFSSFIDYTGNRSGKLINKDVAELFGLKVNI